jgi:hypothetical protein
VEVVLLEQPVEQQSSKQLVLRIVVELIAFGMELSVSIELVLMLSLLIKQMPVVKLTFLGVSPQEQDVLIMLDVR